VCESPSVNFRPPTPNGTSFPEPILTAGSFDKQLFHKAGQVVGKEARVMMNVGNAGGTFWCVRAHCNAHSPTVARAQAYISGIR
jgi:hypothetical protein